MQTWLPRVLWLRSDIAADGTRAKDANCHRQLVVTVIPRRPY
jgi:hypothetical protein